MSFSRPELGAGAAVQEYSSVLTAALMKCGLIQNEIQGLVTKQTALFSVSNAMSIIASAASRGTQYFLDSMSSLGNLLSQFVMQGVGEGMSFKYGKIAEKCDGAVEEGRLVQNKLHELSPSSLSLVENSAAETTALTDKAKNLLNKDPLALHVKFEAEDICALGSQKPEAQEATKAGILDNARKRDEAKMSQTQWIQRGQQFQTIGQNIVGSGVSMKKSAQEATTGQYDANSQYARNNQQIIESLIQVVSKAMDTAFELATAASSRLLEAVYNTAYSFRG